jgi:hypothetical protein
MTGASTSSCRGRLTIGAEAARPLAGPLGMLLDLSASEGEP